MSDPKKHHFVPAFYLANWTDGGTRDSQLWVHSTKADPRLSTPNAEACEIDLHAIVDEHGDKDVTIEHKLGVVEGIFAPLIRKIITDKGGHNLSTDEKGMFSWFVALTMCRNPTYFDRQQILIIEFNEALKEAVKGDKRKLALALERSRSGESAESFLAKNDVDAWLKEEKLHEYHHLHGLDRHSKKLAKMIREDFQWFFWCASGSEEYCTCDDPVICEANGRQWEGVGSPGVKIYFPLNPKICFFAHKQQKILSRESVEEVNEKVIWQASRFIYTKSKDVTMYGPLECRRTAERACPKETEMMKHWKAVNFPLVS